MSRLGKLGCPYSQQVAGRDRETIARNASVSGTGATGVLTRPPNPASQGRADHRRSQLLTVVWGCMQERTLTWSGVRDTYEQLSGL
ncbi:unnamed protein product, partial [Sphenostylis stenocarpa]